MKPMIRASLLLGLMIGLSGSVQACWFWPFGGYWGAGYNGYGYGAPAAYAPYGGGYAPGYYSAGYYPGWSTNFYSAAYAPASSGCCAPGCCDPCGGCCAGGSCASGSCGGVSNSGTLKPETDSRFNKSDSEYDRDRAGSGTQDRDPLDGERGFEPRRRTNESETVPDDNFGRAGTSGSGAGTGTDTGTGTGTGTGTSDQDSGMFGDDLDNSSDNTRINKKPPMSDPAAGDGKTFLDEGTAPAGDSATPEKPPADDSDAGLGVPQARRDLSVSLAARSSSFNEVLKPRRLASRSLPVEREPVTAGSGEEKSVQSAVGSRSPVRWIGVPAREGVTRL